MKISRADAIPVPEMKPAPPATGGGDFAALLNGAPPTPMRKPEPPSITAAGAPLPRVKPDPIAVQEAQAPLPARKPDAPAQTAAQDPTNANIAAIPIPLPERKPDPLAAQIAQAPTPERKPPLPAPPLPAPLEKINEKINEKAAVAAAATDDDDAPNFAERIALASKQVAGLSGHSYKTILAQATQESGLDPNKKSPTSSAAGPFQFLEKTWLDMFRRHGAAYGMGELASKIQMRDGSPVVADAATKKKILELRHDVDVSAGMAARLLSEGRQRLEERLKRPVSETESRLAYVFGVGGALTLLRAAEKTPDRPAAELLPGAAKANGPLFYDRKTGAALSVTETLSRLQKKMNVDQRDMFAAIDQAGGRMRLDGGASPFNAFQTAGDAPSSSPFDAEAVAETRKPV